MGFQFLRVRPCQHDSRAYIMVDKKRKRELGTRPAHRPILQGSFSGILMFSQLPKIEP